MISVDTVYQTVLALANKEQRGYITPQEFNLYAEHAQMSIFEQYFYDLNQFKRAPGNDSKYTDMVDLLEDKINFFKRQTTSTHGATDTFYRLVDVSINGKVVEEIKSGDVVKTQNSPLTKATSDRPVFWKRNSQILFSPSSGSYSVNYIVKPTPPNWTYIVVNEKPLYNNIANTQDFELHPSEQTALVVKILQLAGVTIKDFNLVQVAAQEEVKNIQQEKQ